MASLCKVILIGRVGRDPELRHLNSGKSVVNLSLATTSKRKDRDGESVEDTQWHRLTAYDKLAEIISQYVRKGSLIYVEGSIKYGKFTDKDGHEKNTTDIAINQMQMLGKNEGHGGDSGYERPQARRREEPAQQQDLDDMDDDIPFN